MNISAAGADTQVRLVLLTVDGQTYGLPLAGVDRVLRMVEITPLPEAPAVVEGIVNIQGEIVACVSIRRRLGLAPRSPAAADSLVVTRTRSRRLAVIAESVVGVAALPSGAVVSSGDIARGIEHIDGVLKTGAGLVLIHDSERFFSAEEERSLDLALEGR